MRELFEAHAPEMLPSVPILMSNWRGKENRLLDRFRKQFELDEMTRAREEKVLKRPEPHLPKLGMKGRELGWLGDDRVGPDGALPTNRTNPKVVELPRIGHPGRELGWIGVSVNDPSPRSVTKPRK